MMAIAGAFTHKIQRLSFGSTTSNVNLITICRDLRGVILFAKKERKAI